MLISVLARQFTSELQEILPKQFSNVFEIECFHVRKCEILQELYQIMDGIKHNIENEQEQLLQNITQAEGELPGIHQQLDDVELHITKSINKLILQLDTLMKELTIYGENSVIEKLKTIKTDALKSKDKMMKKLTQKREHVTKVKKKLEITKVDITTDTDLLKQLSDKHDQAKQRIETFNLELPIVIKSGDNLFSKFKFPKW